MPRLAPTALATGLVLLASACGAPQRKAVPNVTGQRLDVAEDTLDARGLRYRTAGGGAFGIVVRSNWVVCEQSPPPRHVASSVLLIVARTCAEDELDNDDCDWVDR